jgi:hypothetical protein
MKFLVLLIAVALTVGCASKQTFELAEYNRDHEKIYPPISFTLNDGYVHTDHSCSQYACYTYRDNSDQFLIKELRKTSLFERVDINNAYSEYAFDVKFYDTYKGSEASELSKLMLGAATLFLVPTVSGKKAVFSVSVRHKNKILKEYLYDLEYTEKKSIFVDPESGTKNSIAYFVSRLMSDLEKDKILLRTKPRKFNTDKAA